MTKINRGGAQPTVLKAKTGRRLTAKTRKPRRPHLRRFRTALRRAERDLMRAMKEVRESLETLGRATAFFDIEGRATEQIIDHFESVRAYCEENLNQPLAAEFIGFANSAEQELCRFVAERCILCQEIIEAMEMAELENEQGF